MAEHQMAPRSPLQGHLRIGRHGREDGAARVILEERVGLAAALIALRGGQDAQLRAALHERYGLAVPDRPGCVAAGMLELVWHGPGQWLALDAGRPGLSCFSFAPDLAATLGKTASVTDLTGARAILRLSGPRVRDALCKLVPVDLDEAVFAPGAASLTLAGHLGVALWRSPGFDDAWNLACLRSLGASLAEAVLEAAAEFGCEVTAPA